STDGGHTFFQRPFSGMPNAIAPGPIAVMCIDSDRCFAYNGLDFEAGTMYVYFTTNASHGVNSTWAPATIPDAIARADQADPRYMFFAPDDMHGWLVGSNNAQAMVLRTTDGGHTWTDASGPVLSASDHKLATGFALDADHVWLGGDNGAFL